jgi:hypothetical protein
MNLPEGWGNFLVSPPSIISRFSKLLIISFLQDYFQFIDTCSWLWSSELSHNQPLDCIPMNYTKGARYLFQPCNQLQEYGCFQVAALPLVPSTQFFFSFLTSIYFLGAFFSFC